MGFRAAQWFLGLARYELVHCSTHPNTLRYCHQHYHTTPFHFSPDMSFVQYLIWTPPAPVWQRQRPTHWFNPALFCNNLFPCIFLYPVWNLSAVVQLHIRPQFGCFITSFSLSASFFPALTPGLAFAPDLQPHLWLQTCRPWSAVHHLCPPAPRLSSAYSQSLPYHPVQARKQVFRLGPVSVSVCVCHSPPLSTGGLVGERCQILLV